MFDSKTSLTGRLTDAVDLLIDFATLGEYGMEPVERPAASCESRHRAPLAARDPSARGDRSRPWTSPPAPSEPEQAPASPAGGDRARRERWRWALIAGGVVAVLLPARRRPRSLA